MVQKSSGVRQSCEKVPGLMRGINYVKSKKTMHAPVAQRLLYPLQGLDAECSSDGIRLRIDGIRDNCILRKRRFLTIAVI